MAKSRLAKGPIDWIWLLLAIAAGAIPFIFYDGFIEMEHHWSVREEYSHGYMIPLVALFLLWKQLPELKAIDWQPTWLAFSVDHPQGGDADYRILSEQDA